MSRKDLSLVRKVWKYDVIKILRKKRKSFNNLLIDKRKENNFVLEDGMKEEQSTYKIKQIQVRRHRRFEKL